MSGYNREKLVVRIKSEHAGKNSRNSVVSMVTSPPSPLMYSTSNSGLGSNSSHSEVEFVSEPLSSSGVKDDCISTEQISMDLYSSLSTQPSPSSSPLGISDSPEVYPSNATPADSSLNNDASSEYKGNDSQKRICLVCGDVASGFHYGVASCEACKAFFKRTIQGNIEYSCPSSNECEINKRRRKACQACRFQKCLAMGMLKEGVRLDRVRGGRQKYWKSVDTSYHVHPVPFKKPTLDENKLMMALQSCEPEAITARTDLVTSSMEADLKMMTLLSDIIDRELVGTICWAKQIPGFTKLSFNDQMRLLKTAWAEILSLLLAYRSLQYTGTTVCLVFAQNLTVDEQQASECGLNDVYNGLVRLIQRLDSLSLTKEEYLALKALLLTNADTQLEDTASVQSLREHLLTTLHDCVASSRTSSSSVIQHYGELLLCLPLLRQLGAEVKRFWCGVRRDAKVPMNKLFVEMLEPHNLQR